MSHNHLQNIGMAASYQSHVANEKKKKNKNPTYTTFPLQKMALNRLRLDDYKDNNKINVISDYM